ncbi:MAG: PD-(D/E)XK nuclease family protein [Halobacteriales archaeon]|nr:PD-(D/E)XK nuclease family protein [Halobacteriales archaeon]
MAAEPNLVDELRSLENRWNRITEAPPTPRTTMQVIEYSLESQQKAEVYVNRLLRYLLDPTEPHGMGEEFLRAFLEAMPSRCAFDEDTYDLSRIEVDQQVPIWYTDPRDGDESPGYVDLVITAPNEWFVLVELKFYAGENNLRGDGHSQTEAYVAKEYVGEQAKRDFESNGYYVYVHPADSDGARADAFGDLTWRALLDRVVEPLLLEQARRYPHRTVVQLQELADDLTDLTGMTDSAPDVTEKVALYLDHYDAIHDVSQAFEARWEEFTERWPARLRDELAVDGVTVDDWTFQTHRKDWGSLFRDGWWRRQSDREVISDRIDRPSLRVMFTHRLAHHREDALGDDTLIFYFRNAGANDQTFIDAFNDRFDERAPAIEACLPDRAVLTGQRRNLIRAEYHIDRDDHDDFFAAYIGALERAFRDHAIENEALVRIITEVYEAALEHAD